MPSCGPLSSTGQSDRDIPVKTNEKNVQGEGRGKYSEKGDGRERERERENEIWFLTAELKYSNSKQSRLFRGRRAGV